MWIRDDVVSPIFDSKRRKKMRAMKNKTRKGITNI